MNTLTNNLPRLTLTACLAMAAWFSAIPSYGEDVSDFKTVSTIVKELGDKHGAANVLLVFGVDNTLLASSNDLGSAHWLRWQTTLLDSNPKSPLLAAGDLKGLHHVQRLLLAAFPMRLTQPELPGLFKQWKEAGFPAIAQTPRSLALQDVTRQELQRLGLTFDNLPNDGFAGSFSPYSADAPGSAGLTAAEITQFGLGDPAPVLFTESLYLTGDQHAGVMLRTLLHWIKQQPKAIVYVDAQKKHVD